MVYLTVDSDGLVDAHERLVEHFPPTGDVEGDEYVPHVTLGRGGPLETAADLAGPVEDPVEWTAGELAFHDAEAGRQVGRLSLPP